METPRNEAVRVPRKRSETRARLLSAARSLMTERGLDRVSVEAIAEHAGYTRGAFYSNFGSINDLLLALYEQHSDELVAELRSSTNDVSRAGAFASLEEAVAHVVSALPFDVEWFRIRTNLAVQAARDPDLSLLYIERESALREELTPSLLRMVHAFDRELTVDPDTFSRALVAAHDGALANSFADTEPRGIRVIVCTGVVLGLTTPTASPAQPREE